MTFITTFLTFIFEHLEIIEAIKDAIEGGRTKADILNDIRAGMVAASDLAVEAELGPRPPDTFRGPAQ